MLEQSSTTFMLTHEFVGNQVIYLLIFAFKINVMVLIIIIIHNKLMLPALHGIHI